MASLKRPPHLLTLADLSPIQIYKILGHAAQLKRLSSPLLQRARVSHSGGLLSDPYYSNTPRKPLRTLESKSIALLFSKRSTRTRLAAETAAFLLGGQAVFMGREDVQMGVNESVRDTVRVVGGMCQGIFARVGEHAEIEEMVKYAEVPIVNALSSLWHPTQVLADLLTLHQQPEFQIPMPGLDVSNTHTPPPPDTEPDTETEPLLYPPPPSQPTNTPNLKPDPSYTQTFHNLSRPSLPPIRPLTIAYIGDSANVLHDMLVTYPRLGHSLRVASPPDPKYRAPDVVWERVVEGGGDRDWVEDGRKGIVWVEDPREAVRGADVVVTDTWISMGSEHETPARLAAFSGYEVTESLCLSGGANPGWKFMHCLPRHKEEVDDEVFYGPRSLVFPEAENRKWTIMAVFDYIFGRQMLPSTNVPSVGAYAKESQGLQGLRGESRERERGYGGSGRSNRDNRDSREYRDNRDARDRDNRDARVQRQGRTQGRIDPIDRELERLERQLERVRSQRALSHGQSQGQSQGQGQSQSGRGMERARMRASASAGIANANTNANTIAANFTNANIDAKADELVGLEGYETSDIDIIYTDTDIHDNMHADPNIHTDPNIHNNMHTETEIDNISSDPDPDPESETHTQMDGTIGTGPLHVPGRDAGRNMGKAERIGVGAGGVEV